MKIELFIRSIGQDFPDKTESVYKSLNYNNKGHRQRAHICRQNGKSRFLNDIKLRTESFGGIIYDLQKKAVYTIDNDAYKAISYLIDGSSFEDLSSVHEFTPNEVESLKSSLFKFGLCTN